jgi:hypothetical protein
MSCKLLLLLCFLHILRITPVIFCTYLTFLPTPLILRRFFGSPYFKRKIHFWFFLNWVLSNLEIIESIIYFIYFFVYNERTVTFVVIYVLVYYFLQFSAIDFTSWTWSRSLTISMSSRIGISTFLPSVLIFVLKFFVKFITISLFMKFQFLLLSLYVQILFFFSLFLLSIKYFLTFVINVSPLFLHRLGTSLFFSSVPSKDSNLTIHTNIRFHFYPVSIKQSLLLGSEGSSDSLLPLSWLGSLAFV